MAVSGRPAMLREAVKSRFVQQPIQRRAERVRERARKLRCRDPQPFIHSTSASQRHPPPLPTRFLLFISITNNCATRFFLNGLGLRIQELRGEASRESGQEVSSEEAAERWVSGTPKTSPASTRPENRLVRVRATPHVPAVCAGARICLDGRSMNLHELAGERSLALHEEVARRLREDPALLGMAGARVEDWLRQGSVHSGTLARGARSCAAPSRKSLSFSRIGAREHARCVRYLPSREWSPPDDVGRSGARSANGWPREARRARAPHPGRRRHRRRRRDHRNRQPVGSRPVSAGPRSRCWSAPGRFGGA